MAGSESPPKRVTSADAAPAFPASTQESLESVAAAKRAAQARAPEVARALGLDPLETLQVRTTHVNAEGSVHTDTTITIKYDRAYAGVPVVPGMIGVGLTRSGEIRGVTVYPIGSVAVPSTTAIVSAEEAARLAIATTDWGEAVARIPTFTGKPVSAEEYERRPLMARGQPDLVIFIPHAPHYSAQGETWECWHGAPSSLMDGKSQRKCSSMPRPLVLFTGVRF